MKRTLIRYRTKPELADQNAAILAACADAAGVLTNLAAFKAFQSGIRERCIEPPQPGSATIVGNYRMLAEP